MTTRTGPWIDPNIVEYLRAHTAPPDEVIDWITEQTLALGKFSAMQIGSDQVALMTLLTRLVGAKTAVEVGTFTGTSALAIARGLSEGGRLLCCDVSNGRRLPEKDGDALVWMIASTSKSHPPSTR